MTSEADLSETFNRLGLGSGDSIRRVTPDDSYFVGAREVSEKYGLPNQAFENFRKLLCGIRNYPFILLRNPKNDELKFKSMVRDTFTLSWLQFQLSAMGFDFKDIIIMEICPMLTESWLERNSEKKRLEAMKDMFELTLEFVAKFKPPSILALQCEPWEETWKGFKHPALKYLRSSGRKAEARKPYKFEHKGHSTNVIYGFHPGSFGWENDQCDESLLQEIIECAFNTSKFLEKRRKREMRKSLDQLHTSGQRALENCSEYMTMLETNTETDVPSKHEVLNMLATLRGSIREMCASTTHVKASLGFSHSDAVSDDLNTNRSPQTLSPTTPGQMCSSDTTSQEGSIGMDAPAPLTPTEVRKRRAEERKAQGIISSAPAPLTPTEVRKRGAERRKAQGIISSA